MRLISDSFDDGQPIPAEFAFGIPDPRDHIAFGPNRNPHLRWEDVPNGTRSFVVMCTDSDVPSRPDDVNQEGREIPADLPRTDFTHWVVVDLPASTTEIAAGEFSAGVVPRGKDGGVGRDGGREGLNDYTGWFQGDEDMEGDYHGYDGPCPPWNDSIVHHYVFSVHALDVERCDVSGSFTAEEVRAAIEGHILGSAELTGTYVLNPRLEA